MVPRVSVDGLSFAYSGCCNFVRLHGWCDQTDERIASLVDMIQVTPEDSARFETEVIGSLKMLDTAEEKLLALLVLVQLGADLSQVSEWTLEHLENQIDEKDSDFIDRHYYGNRSPVPADLVYTVTKGNFINYKRALYEALKVSQFESDFDPPHVLLYLTQLLCRNSLNKQNRAIVYLLLSRIDIDLPPNLLRIVLAAMARLRNLINEVEVRQEAVLADEIGTEEALLDDPITWEKSSIPSLVQATPAASATLEPAQAPVLISTTQVAGRSARQPPLPAAVTSGVPPQVQPLPTDALVIETGSPAEPIAPAVLPARIASGRDEGFLDPVAPAVATERPSRVPMATVMDAPSQVGVARPVVPRPNRSNPPAPTSQPTAQASRSRYVIRFNREERSLVDLIEQPEDPADQPNAESPKAATAPEVPSEPEVAVKPKTPTQKRLSAPPKVRPQPKAPAHPVVPTPPEVKPQPEVTAQTRAEAQTKPPVLPPEKVHVKEGVPRALLGRKGLVGTGLFLLLGMGLLLVLFTRQPPPPPVVSPPSSTAAGTEPVVPTPGLERDGTEMTWSPQPGDSLWTLFVELRTTPQVSAGLGNLSALSWESFVKKVQADNPGIAIPDLIYPNQKIRLTVE